MNLEELLQTIFQYIPDEWSLTCLDLFPALLLELKIFLYMGSITSYIIGYLTEMLFNNIQENQPNSFYI